MPPPPLHGDPPRVMMTTLRPRADPIHAMIKPPVHAADPIPTTMTTVNSDRGAGERRIPTTMTSPRLAGREVSSTAPSLLRLSADGIASEPHANVATMTTTVTTTTNHPGATVVRTGPVAVIPKMIEMVMIVTDAARNAAATMMRMTTTVTGATEKAQGATAIVIATGIVIVTVTADGPHVR